MQALMNGVKSDNGGELGLRDFRTLMARSMSNDEAATGADSAANMPLTSSAMPFQEVMTACSCSCS